MEEVVVEGQLMLLQDQVELVLHLQLRTGRRARLLRLLRRGPLLPISRLHHLRIHPIRCPIGQIIHPLCRLLHHLFLHLFRPQRPQLLRRGQCLRRRHRLLFRLLFLQLHRHPGHRLLPFLLPLLLRGHPLDLERIRLVLGCREGPGRPEVRVRIRPDRGQRFPDPHEQLFPIHRSKTQAAILCLIGLWMELFTSMMSSPCRLGLL